MILLITDYFMHIYLKYTHKRVDYNEYLKSKHWRKMKYKVLKRANYKCSICSDRKHELHIHHNRYYDNNSNSVLYWEKPSDLICVCGKCHNLIHTYIYVPKSKREKREVS